MHLIRKQKFIVILLFPIFYISCNSKLKKEDEKQSLKSLTYQDSTLIYKYKAELADVDFEIEQMSPLFFKTVDGNIDDNSLGQGYDRINHTNRIYLYNEPYTFYTNIHRTSGGGKYYLNYSIRMTEETLKNVIEITHITISADSLVFEIDNPKMKNEANVWFVNDVACLEERNIKMVEKIAKAKEVKIKFEAYGNRWTENLTLSKKNLETLHDTQIYFSLLKKKENLEDKLLEYKYRTLNTTITN